MKDEEPRDMTDEEMDQIARKAAELIETHIRTPEFIAGIKEVIARFDRNEIVTNADFARLTGLPERYIELHQEKILAGWSRGAVRNNNARAASPALPAMLSWPSAAAWAAMTLLAVGHAWPLAASLWAPMTQALAARHQAASKAGDSFHPMLLGSSPLPNPSPLRMHVTSCSK